MLRWTGGSSAILGKKLTRKMPESVTIIKDRDEMLRDGIKKVQKKIDQEIRENQMNEIKKTVTKVLSDNISKEYQPKFTKENEKMKKSKRKKNNNKNDSNLLKKDEKQYTSFILPEFYESESFLPKTTGILDVDLVFDKIDPQMKRPNPTTSRIVAPKVDEAIQEKNLFHFNQSEIFDFYQETLEKSIQTDSN